MRRPIFGNGIPRNILMADGDVTVLDTTQLDPKQTYALTLFLWWYGPKPVAIPNPELSLRVQTNGGPSRNLGTFLDVYLDTIWTDPTSPGIGEQIRPLKVLDRYMVRGNQQVLVANTALGSAYCFVWGYFEQAGIADATGPFRGLQPAAPVAPFSYPPVEYVFAAGPAQQAQTIHQLSATHVDVLTIDARTDAAAYGAGGEDVQSALVFPGGGVVTLPTTTTNKPYRIFDGIPMRAPSSADVNIQLAGQTPLTAASGTAYGSFYRY